jgi:hypothetical protein
MTRGLARVSVVALAAAGAWSSAAHADLPGGPGGPGPAAIGGGSDLPSGSAAGSAAGSATGSAAAGSATDGSDAAAGSGSGSATPASSSQVTAAPKQQRVVVAYGLLQRHGVSWDLTVSGGVRLWHGDGDQTRWGFGRARAGVMMFREPTFVLVGITGQYSPLGSTALGIEAEYLNLWSGAWGQVGFDALDSVGGVSTRASVGYALFGVEYQRRLSGTRSGDQALLLELQVPLGVIKQSFTDPEGVIHPEKMKMKTSRR